MVMQVIDIDSLWLRWVSWWVLQVAIRAHENGLEYCIVNGLEPESNRAVLDLCLRHSHSLLPALGRWRNSSRSDEEGDVLVWRERVAVSGCCSSQHYVSDSNK